MQNILEILYNDFNIITFCPVFVKFMHTISSFITIIIKQENCTPLRRTVFLTYYMEFIFIWSVLTIIDILV